MKKDKYELDIVKSFEAGEWHSIKDLEKKKRDDKRYALNTSAKIKRISVQLSEKDLNKLKAKSLEEGIPFHMMVSGIIHKYLNGKIKIGA
jgi:predicted DNA binding CopG/RHH family protein